MIAAKGQYRERNGQFGLYRTLSLAMTHMRHLHIIAAKRTHGA
jgi:hypothetical protein